jgi:hypothetical protein
MPNIQPSIEIGQAKQKLDVAHILAASGAVQTAAYLMGVGLSIETLGSGTPFESNGRMAR